jgi:hypothetical protein
MKRSSLVRLFSVLTAVTLCSLWWAGPVQGSTTVVDPHGGFTGVAEDNFWNYTSAVCANGIAVHADQTQMSTDYQEYSLNLTTAVLGDSYSNDSSQQLTTTATSTLQAHDDTSTLEPQAYYVPFAAKIAGLASPTSSSPLQHGTLIYPFTSTLTLPQDVTYSIDRWDHAQHSFFEDDDESNGGDDADGDGVPGTDESSFDDHQVQTTAAGACSVLPTTAVTAPTTALDSNTWYTSPVTVKLEATDDAAWYVSTDQETTPQAPDMGIQSVSYSGSGAQGFSGSATVPAMGDASTAPALDATLPTVNTDGVTTITYYATDTLGNSEASHSVSVQLDTHAPTVACPATTPTFFLHQSGATFAATFSDPSPGSGLVGSSSVTSNTLNTSSVGTFNATFPSVSDVAGNVNSTATCPYRVVYSFTGFFSPIASPPTLNDANAGRSVPVKFSLAGNQGLSVLSGVPTVQPISCRAPFTPSGSPTAVAPSIGSSLTYDSTTGQYTFTWKTPSNIRGCQLFSLSLNDGTAAHTAYFKF